MAEEVKTGTPAEGQDNGIKTYTQEEVDKLLQAETDRRVTSALKKAEEKNNEKIAEAKKLAQMNESQKYEYELSQREKAIAEKERELALSENRNEASKILAEKGLSLDLVSFVVAESAEDMDTNIKLLEKAFKTSVKAEVEKRLGSSTPKKNLGVAETITREQFRNMSLAQMAELQQNEPELYNSLRG